MDFKNVKVPEGINVSRHSPLADLFILSAGAIGLFVAAALLVYMLGGTVARYMPVSWENALVGSVLDSLPRAGATQDTPAGPAAQVTAELQALADRLSARMELPEDLRITVHYLEGDQVNAFATLGGQVFFFRGLLARLPSENALAMVMAHEIAHAANRDPAATMGGGLLLQLVMAVVLGASPGSLEELIYGPGALLQMGFTRELESLADRDALAAVAALYGHVNGAGHLFEIFLEEAEQQGQNEPPAFLSTHPLSRDRIAALETLAAVQDWAREGVTTPLQPAVAELGEVE